MDEREFLNVADATLQQLEVMIESATAAAGIDCDIELQPGGVIQLVFADDSKIIINRHAAAREIWVAARAGGFHFRHHEDRWVDTRSGDELNYSLSRLISQQGGASVAL